MMFRMHDHDQMCLGVQSVYGNITSLLGLCFHTLVEAYRVTVNQQKTTYLGVAVAQQVVL